MKKMFVNQRNERDDRMLDTTTMMDFGKKMKNAKKTKGIKNGRYTTRQLLAIATLAVLTCCANVACTWQHSELDEGGGVLPVPKQDEVQLEQVTLKLVIHDGLNQTKAALSDGAGGDETKITRVDAFVFDQVSGDFRYKAVTSAIKDAEDGSGEQVVDVTLEVLPSDIRDNLVSIQFLANSWGASGSGGGIAANWNEEDELWVLPPAEVLTSLAAVRSRLGYTFHVDQSDNVTQYNYVPYLDEQTGDVAYTYSNPNPVAIPMWGQLQNVAVSRDEVKYVPNGAGSETDLPEVKLLRMIARIDVNLAASVALSKNLTLGDIVYYNYPERGRIIPDPGVFTDPSYPLVAKAPSFIGGIDLANTGIDSIVYKASTIAQTDTNTIYSFEESATVNSNRLWQNCLVVQLIDKDDPTDFSYHRIDFLRTNANQDEQIAIIRNHHYFVNIKNVKSVGYDTPREALESAEVTITVEIAGFNDDNVIEWVDENDIGGDEIH
jgi:hypothetical protein